MSSEPAARMSPPADMEGWRVLVVDDSIVVRAAVRAMLLNIPEVARIETARSASAALGILQAASATAPIDVVLLDVEMPSMNGIEALPHLLKVSPTSRVVMASSLTRRGAAVTMAALAAGASDYLCKPSAATGEALQGFERELAAKLAAWAAHARRERADSSRRPASRAVSPPPPARPAQAAAAVPPPTPQQPARPAVRSLHARRPAMGAPMALRPCTALAIGSSTGGPQALMQFFGDLAAPLACPVFVTQHMPATFTAMLAEQIGRLTGGACREAVHGEPAVAGRIYVAPGDRHLLVRGEPGQRPMLILDDGEPENFCRPAVDPMLRSLVQTYGDGLCVVILTGMGQDGLVGCRLVKAQGGQVIVQDEATSVVWGMPGAVARNGLADHILPVGEITALLRPQLGRSCRGAA